MKKIILTLLITTALFTGCKKDEPVQQNCPKIIQKYTKPAPFGNSYYYFLLMDGQRLEVTYAIYQQWKEGAEYTPVCVR